MCSTWRSSGIATARAASITRSTSRVPTSPPRTATIPWLLRPRICGPATPTTADADAHAGSFFRLVDRRSNRLDRRFDIDHDALAQAGARRDAVAERRQSSRPRAPLRDRANLAGADVQSGEHISHRVTRLLRSPSSRDKSSCDVSGDLADAAGRALRRRPSACSRTTASPGAVRSSAAIRFSWPCHCRHDFDRALNLDRCAIEIDHNFGPRAFQEQRRGPVVINAASRK